MTSEDDPVARLRARNSAARSTTELISYLDEDIVAMTAEVSMLRYEVQEEREARRRLTLAVIGIVMSALILGWLAWENHRALGEVRHTNELIARCTTPDPDPSDDVSHACFEAFTRALTGQPTATTRP